MLGASATCPPVDIGPDPPLPSNGCWSVDGTATCWIRRRDDPSIYIKGYADPVVAIVSVEPDQLTPESPAGSTSTAHLLLPDGRVRFADSGAWEYDVADWYLEPDPGSTCTSNGPDGTPPVPNVPDHTYTDPETNCNYNVKFEGFIRETPDGPILPVFEVSGGEETRASGGRMGGCNLNPTIHVSPPNGPGGPGGPRIPPIPVPPNAPGPIDGIPWWAGPLLGAATGAALQLIGQEIAKLTEPNYLPGSFTMTAPCDVDDEGNPQFRTWEFEEGSFQQRINAHQVALMEMLQQHLNWKTPICRERPKLEGDWRTVSFRSDNTSPYGKSRLRKRFRYRSTSGLALGALVDHWKDFSFTSGPVIVSHAGASWGTPQVWAATADEGKRVIRHAAGEAGIDPDQTGRWVISGSGSARYGVSDTMRVDTTGGYFWITARDGEDGRPLVAQVPIP